MIQKRRCPNIGKAKDIVGCVPKVTLEWIEKDCRLFYIATRIGQWINPEIYE